MIRLDVKDRKLLYFLSNNCRFSHTQLAKFVGLSKNSISYRIDRFRKNGVIKHFATTVNLGSLGLTTVTLLLKFNDDIYEKTDIIDFFKTHPFADWVVTLSGEWDVFVEFVTNDYEHTHKIIDDIIDKFSSILNTYQVFFSRDTIRVEHLVKDFYSDLKLAPLEVKPRVVKKHSIDDVDKKVLDVLSKDSSLPFLQIAKQLNISIDVVRYRIKNMINNGIIVKFFPEIDLAKLGYTEYLVKLELHNLSKSSLSNLKNILRNNDNVTYAFLDMNVHRLIFVVAFKSADDIDHLSRQLRKQFKDIIDNQEFFLVKEQVLFNLFPRGLQDVTS